MRPALRKAAGALLVVLALAIPRRGEATDARPVVRVVLMAGGDAPPWFDGFVKHLERELGLRGIEVLVARGERENAPRIASGTSASAAPDAELVVEAPSALRPVLRFAVAPRDRTAIPEGSAAGRLRQVNLAGIPADGWALALAVAADELMRSNWPRAVPSEPARTDASKPVAEKAEESPPSAPVQAPTSEARARGSSSEDGERRDTAVPGSEISGGAGFHFRSSIGAAAAGETFGGGQTQLGADVRWLLGVLPRLDLEVRAGGRAILRQPTTNGAVDGTAIVAGAAVGTVVLSGARANLSLVGRADLVRVAYRGQPRDANVEGTSESGFTFVVSAGPRARAALSRSIGLQADLLAGASPFATTATDAGQAVFATNGAAFLGSVGLFLGL